MKTQFKVGMKVDDGIGVGVVSWFTEDGYPFVTFINQEDSISENWQFSSDDIHHLKEYKEERYDTN